MRLVICFLIENLVLWMFAKKHTSMNWKLSPLCAKFLKHSSTLKLPFERNFKITPKGCSTTHQKLLWKLNFHHFSLSMCYQVCIFPHILSTLCLCIMRFNYRMSTKVIFSHSAPFPCCITNTFCIICLFLNKGIYNIYTGFPFISSVFNPFVNQLSFRKWEWDFVEVEAQT